MARAAVTKLLLLVILAFIICLPEFFRIYSVSKVNFLCLPYLPYEQRYQELKAGNGQPGNGENERKSIRDPTSTPDHEQWEQICTQKTHNRNTTDLHAETQEARGGDSRRGWFMCETDKNMEEFNRNISSTAVMEFLEVSVSFLLNGTGIVNLTLYSHSNRSFLYLQPPEEEGDQMGDDADQGEAFYCCLPLIPTANSANQSPCLLWLANQTVLTGTETERLPWKRADKGDWCRFKVIWLVLLCVVFLIVVTAVIGKIYVGQRLNKKPILHHIDYHPGNQQLKGRAYRLNQFQSWSGLSPIPEIESQDENQILLDKNPLFHYTENPSSSLPSSSLLPHRRTGVLSEAPQKEHRNGLKAH